MTIVQFGAPIDLCMRTIAPVCPTFGWYNFHRHSRDETSLPRDIRIRVLERQVCCIFTSSVRQCISSHHRISLYSGPPPMVRRRAVQVSHPQYELLPRNGVRACRPRSSATCTRPSEPSTTLRTPARVLFPTKLQGPPLRSPAPPASPPRTTCCAPIPGHLRPRTADPPSRSPRPSRAVQRWRRDPLGLGASPPPAGHEALFSPPGTAGSEGASLLGGRARWGLLGSLASPSCV